MISMIVIHVRVLDSLIIVRLQIEWHQNWSNCNQRHAKLNSSCLLMEPLTTSKCWSRTNNIFRSLQLLRNAMSCPNSCSTLVLPGKFLDFFVIFY